MNKIVPFKSVFIALLLSGPPPTLSQEVSLSALESVSQELEELFNRRLYSESLGVSIAPVSDEEMENLLLKTLALKREVETAQEHGEGNLLNNYMMIYEKVVLLFSGFFPERTGKINTRLAPTVSIEGGGHASFVAQSIKEHEISALNPERKSKYDVRFLEGGQVALSYAPWYLKEMASVSVLFRGDTSPNEKLFSVAQKAILQQLKNSKKLVERLLLSAGDPLPVHREISDSLADSLTPVNSKLLARILQVLQPGTTYAPDSEEVALARENFVTWIAENAKVYFLYRILRERDWDSPGRPPRRLADFLCDSFNESFRDGIETNIESLSQDIDQATRLREILSEAGELSPSCDFLRSWTPQTREQVLWEWRRMGAKGAFEEFVGTLERAVDTYANREAFLAAPIHIKSALEYHAHTNLASLGTFPRSFATWWFQLLFHPPTSYQKLKTVFTQEYKRQKAAAAGASDKIPSAGGLLQKVSEEAARTLPFLQNMAKFFRFEEENQAILQNSDLPGITDSQEKLELLRELTLENWKDETLLWAHEVEKTKKYPEIGDSPSYEILQKLPLFTSIGENHQENRRLVEEALRRVSRKINESRENVSTWKKLNDMETALKNSRFLALALTGNSEVAGTYLKKSDQLTKEPQFKTALKGLHHKYVGIGFAMMLAVDFGPLILKHIFRWAKGASYLRQMQRGIPPQIRHGFMVSAFSLIGVDLLYETWEVFGREFPRFREARNLYQSSAMGSTGVFAYKEFLAMDENMGARKSEYFIRLGMDSMFFALLLVPRIPWVRHRLPRAIVAVSLYRMRRVNSKFERLFADLGIEPGAITWNKVVLEDVRNLRLTKLRPKLRESARQLRQYLEKSGDIESWRKTRWFRKEVRGNPEFAKMVRSHDKILAKMGKIEEAHRLLLTEYAKFQRRWQKLGVEYRFDFEHLGLPPGSWNARELQEAFGALAKQKEEGLLAASEFARAEESYHFLMELLLRKLYIASRFPTFRALVRESLVEDIGGTFRVAAKNVEILAHGTPKGSKDSRSLNAAEQLDYEVVKWTSESGEVWELIVPKLYRRNLLEKGEM